jgi:hypothetical protein
VQAGAHDLAPAGRIMASANGRLRGGGPACAPGAGLVLPAQAGRGGLRDCWHRPPGFKPRPARGAGAAGLPRKTGRLRWPPRRACDSTRDRTLLPVSSITARGLPGRPPRAMMPPGARCADNCAASSGPLASLPTLATALPPGARAAMVQPRQRERATTGALPITGGVMEPITCDLLQQGEKRPVGFESR